MEGLVKKFYDKWNEEEIDDYVNKYSVLVLFRIHKRINEAEIVLHGGLNRKQNLLLRVCIIGKFGGGQFTDDACIKINDYAKEWYKDFVAAPRKVRVLNFKRKG